MFYAVLLTSQDC